MLKQTFKRKMESRENISRTTYVIRIETKKVLLVCGILSTIVYVVAIILGALQWKEYDSISQTVSELFAIDAPSARLVIPLLLIYSIFVFAFGMGVWLSAGTKRILRVVAGLIIAKEILGVIATLFAPMHMRGIEVSLTDTMHGVLTAVGVLLCMLPTVGFGALIFGKGFRIYSVITIMIFLIFGILAGMNGSKIAENQPTPLAGVWERINILTYFIWVIIFTVKLLRFNEDKEYI
jgi:hypothetical protein